MTQLSLAAYQELHKEDSGVAWYALITIKHPKLAQPLFLTTNTENVVSSVEGSPNTYLATWIDVQIMSSEPERPAEALLRLDAVDQSIVAALELLDEPPTVDIRHVLSSDVETVVAQNLGLIMRGHSTDVQSLTAKLSGPDYLNETAPGVLMTKATTPGIFPR